ncbi:MAG: hypothetical protein KQI78_25740 [Deltaproteobacteria bacterium]|nr:hypothetical protein [Deltaproteobacteria bacterium]
MKTVIETREEHRTRLQATGRMLDGGGFEVVAITSGIGNGWTFPADVLQGSLPLWDGVECFIDHGLTMAGRRSGRSLRDLAGVFSHPRWDDVRQGVVLDLEPVGPGAEVLHQLGHSLIGQSAQPRVGFSADLVFTTRSKTVNRILRVLSVDLVHNPARGGAFLRPIESNVAKTVHTTQNKEEKMSIEGILEEPTVEEETLQISHQEETRTQMSGYLLESALAASRLPAMIARQIRERFQGQEFKPSELQTAIGEARELISALQGPSVVHGPGRVSDMVTAEEMLSAAVDDLFGAPRDPGLDRVAAHPLNGIRDLYMRMTGDHHLHGGYYPERVQLASTLTMANLVANVMNKLVVDQWERLGRAGYDWWRKLVRVEHFTSLQQIKGILVSEIGLLPSVDEGGDYDELPIDDSGETADWSKYGGYLPLTLELIDRDETQKLAQYPRKLANAAMRRISYNVAQVFTANGGVGPTMADSSALFHTNRSNLGTEALSATSWETASQSIYNQDLLVASGETAPILALEPRYVVVPRALKGTARGILVPYWDRAANVYSENLNRLDEEAVVVCPEFTDATDWAAVADPLLAPGIVVGERFGLQPEIFVAGGELSPAMFTNDESRLKVRHFLAVMVVDYRPLYKSNVADS